MISAGVVREMIGADLLGTGVEWDKPVPNWNKCTGRFTLLSVSTGRFYVKF